MRPGKVPGGQLFSALLLALSLTSVGCSSEPALGVEQAASLIKAQFPESEVAVTTTRVEADGSAVALTQFDSNPVSFIFQQNEDGGWLLDAVDFDGSFYFIGDLEQISATMQMMAELGTALERYKAVNSVYPAGEDSAALDALIPRFMPTGTDFQDAWQHRVSYESDGSDYTVISQGPDQTSGSRDDIVLHSGEFVGGPGGA